MNTAATAPEYRFRANSPKAVLSLMNKHDRWISLQAGGILPPISLLLLPVALCADLAQVLFFIFSDLAHWTQRFEERNAATIRAEREKEIARADQEQRRIRARDDAEAKLNFKIVDADSLASCEAEASRLMAGGWVPAGELQHSSWTEHFDNGIYEGSGSRRRESYKLPMRRRVPVVD